MKGADEQCYSAGMDAYLTKPIDRVALELTLARLLDTLRTRQDQGRCVPCGSAAHRSQQCPLIADRLFIRARCVDCGDALQVRCRACAEWAR